jgi:DNA mismatch repair protein MutS2
MLSRNTESASWLEIESLKQLEFFNVLEIISRYATSELGTSIILSAYPSENIDMLNSEHSLVSEMQNLIVSDDQIPLDNLKDIRPQLHKSIVQNSILSVEDILSVRDLIRTFRVIRSYFRSRPENYPGLYERANLLIENRLLEKHISEAIDDSANVKDTASNELSRIRRQLQEKSSRLRTRIQRIVKRVSDEEKLQEDYFSVRDGRFVLPVKIENKRQIPGIIHGVSQSGSTVFLEPSEIIEMNNEISLLLNEEKREIYKILQNLTSEIGDNARGFISSVEVISHIDSVYAKARYSLETGGIKPLITEEAEIFLKNIRHPLLVKTKKNSVIPLSIDFSSAKLGHLISGPNAGGKTVALKSIGLNIAMALSGIFPLGECRTNFRTIFTAIGDNQSIENDLSTFSSQISRIKSIIDYCSKDSLVLIDEIGSGTDPQEGSALAAGIIDSFININLFFVVTTHQSSLKSYALTRNEIENDSLEFNEQYLKPTYKFLTGIPGNSYAFVLAENLGIPENIIVRAKNYIGDRHAEIEESIRILQQVKRESEELRNQAFAEKNKLESARKEYEFKYHEIKKKRQEIMAETRDKAADILKKANSLIENTIREIREEQRAISDIKKDFNIAKNEIASEVKKSNQGNNEPTQQPSFSVGDSVKIEDSTSIGSIITIDDENKFAVVDFNDVKFRFPIEHLIPVTKKEQKKTLKSQPSQSNFKFDSRISIDLRGKRVDECIREVDEFISNAVLGNVTPLTIIHGKGTGALRAAIQEFLASHPSIKTYRNGTLTEGGDGVTVVEI